MNGLISFGPSAQLMPMLNNGKCETEFQYASTVWPESVRPLKSVMVKESMHRARARPDSSNNLAMAKSAALELSESNTVSTSSKSAPPSNKPRACS